MYAFISTGKCHVITAVIFPQLGSMHCEYSWAVYPYIDTISRLCSWQHVTSAFLLTQAVTVVCRQSSFVVTCMFCSVLHIHSLQCWRAEYFEGSLPVHVLTVAALPWQTTDSCKSKTMQITHDIKSNYQDILSRCLLLWSADSWTIAAKGPITCQSSTEYEGTTLRRRQPVSCCVKSVCVMCFLGVCVCVHVLMYVCVCFWQWKGLNPFTLSELSVRIIIMSG